MAATELGCPDNITLMIIDLHEYYLRYHSQQRVSTASPKTRQAAPVSPTLQPSTPTVSTTTIN